MPLNILLFLFIVHHIDIKDDISIIKSINNTTIASPDSSKSYKYNRFEGNIIIVNDYTLRFNNKVLLINTKDNNIKEIFKYGLVYPEIIPGPFVRSYTTSLGETGEYRKYLDFTDTIYITALYESHDENQPFTIRKFHFWLYTKTPIPLGFVFELENLDAKKDTDLKTFIENARLISIKNRGVVI